MASSIDLSDEELEKILLGSRGKDLLSEAIPALPVVRESSGSGADGVGPVKG
jgi:hypothetical protein